MFCFRFPELVSDSFQLKSFKENLVFSFHEALTWNIWISKEMTFVKSVCAWVTYICMGSQHVLGIWFHCWNFKRTSFVLNHWGTDGLGLTLVSCPTRLSSISTSREQIYQSNVLGIRDVANHSTVQMLPLWTMIAYLKQSTMKPKVSSVGVSADQIDW